MCTGRRGARSVRWRKAVRQRETFRFSQPMVRAPAPRELGSVPAKPTKLAKECSAIEFFSVFSISTHPTRGPSGQWFAVFPPALAALVVVLRAAAHHSAVMLSCERKFGARHAPPPLPCLTRCIHAESDLGVCRYFWPDFHKNSVMVSL
mmetsp:Transcript_412/g.635  ORF Transcript_412/g.635 Transcript_412/m.635 type:complete len:149 (+) Transcript_412:774-1220(+)